MPLTYFIQLLATNARLQSKCLVCTESGQMYISCLPIKRHHPVYNKYTFAVTSPFHFLMITSKAVYCDWNKVCVVQSVSIRQQNTQNEVIYSHM